MDVTGELLDWARAILVPILMLVIGWLGAKYKDHQSDVKRLEDKQDANNQATCCLVRKTIIDMYDLFVRHSAPMTVERRHEITDLYNAYKRLGGNGVVDHLYEELASQPTVVVNRHEIPIEGGNIGGN